MRTVYIAGFPVQAAYYSFEDDLADLLESLPMQERIGAYIAYRDRVETRARKRGASVFRRFMRGKR